MSLLSSVSPLQRAGDQLCRVPARLAVTRRRAWAHVCEAQRGVQGRLGPHICQQAGPAWPPWCPDGALRR